jgi:hypothetical protein
MTVTTLLPATELTKTKQQILAILPPLKAEVSLLRVETEEDYQKADALLARIMQSKRWWVKGDAEGKWKGIDAIIRPFKEGLDGLYDLKNDGLKPHEQLEADVKHKMRQYKILEGQRIAAERQAQADEAARLQREIDAKQAKEDAAKTPKMRERLIGQRMELEQQHRAVEQQKPEPVKAARSAARTVRRPVVTDFVAFVTGITTLSQEEDGVPLDLLIVNTQRLALLWKENPELVAQLPGVEIQDDVVIAGR